MPMRKRYIDVVIVGGGIVGTILAMKLGRMELGLSIAVLRLSDTPNPRAESLRNQGLLQSGVRYFFDPSLPETIWRYRSELLLLFGMRSIENEGVIQMPKKEEAAFRKKITGTLFESKVEELQPDEAIKRIGRFWKEGSFTVRAPEHLLDVAEMMSRSRATATADEVAFREVHDVIFLGKAGAVTAPELSVDGHIIQAGIVVFAAGCGNIPYMKDVVPEHGFKVQQTPLLVLRGRPLIQAPVLYDKMIGFSMSSRLHCESIDGGCMVFGASDTERELEEAELRQERRIRAAEAEAILTRLESVAPVDRSKVTFTAGWEPLPPNKSDHVLPQIIVPPENSRLEEVIFAFSGRATLALYAIEKILERLRPLLPRHRGRSTSILNDISDIGTSWDTAINMHFENAYKGRTDQVLVDEGKNDEY